MTCFLKCRVLMSGGKISPSYILRLTKESCLKDVSIPVSVLPYISGRVICLIMPLRLMDTLAASPYPSPDHVILWSVFQSLLLAQPAAIPANFRDPAVASGLPTFCSCNRFEFWSLILKFQGVLLVTTPVLDKEELKINCQKGMPKSMKWISHYTLQSQFF